MAAQSSDIYVFMHHPPFDIEHPLMDVIKLMEPDGFSAAIEGFPVRHLFFGHAHRPISGQWRGIGFSTIPGTCHQLPLVGESLPTVFSDEPAMYAVAHLFPDRTSCTPTPILTASQLLWAPRRSEIAGTRSQVPAGPVVVLDPPSQ